MCVSAGPTLRSSSVRDQLATGGTNAAVVVVPSPQPGCQRGLFGRLGIRKPSILSLTSPHGHSASHQDATATARTFSLDDLLKPPPRRKATAFPCEMPCLWTDLLPVVLLSLRSMFHYHHLSLSLYLSLFTLCLYSISIHTLYICTYIMHYYQITVTPSYSLM